MEPWKSHKKILLIIWFTNIFSGILGSSSRIDLENGQYNGIFIGIDGERISASECPVILANLKTLVEEFSAKLFESTEHRASIGVVNVLLPRTWEHSDCGLPDTPGSILPADLNRSFRNSHIQITTNHSIAEFLPWTRQYRPCGHHGDSIIIPFKFLVNDTTTPTNATPISNSVKAQLLVHEWAKFRYGVFDEIGYEEEEGEGLSSSLFPPCYTHSKQAHLTTCSSPRLAAVVQNASACSLDLFLRYKDKLVPILEKSPTSVMSSPYLDTGTMFCNESSHNRWALTKQNFYCHRKSVAEVVFSHPDFSGTPSPPPVLPSIVSIPDIRILKHPRSSIHPAYAFVIEDSQDMRDQYKILHVKQAIAQFLEILDYGTEVLLIIFSGDQVNTPTHENLESDSEKRKILGMIPDINSEATWKGGQQLSISGVINQLVGTLEGYQGVAWNVLLFANPPDPINDIPSTIKTFHNTSHTISIFTFENTTNENDSNAEDWLEWFTIPNTKNIVALPTCTRTVPRGPCSFQTSSFILDQLVGLLNDQQFNLHGHRFLQSGGPIVFPYLQGRNKTFNLEGEPEQMQRLYFFMPLPPSRNPNPTKTFKMYPPAGEPCAADYLLTYNNLVTFTTNDSCAFQSGEWTVEIDSEPEITPEGGTLLLNIYVEMNDGILAERLLVMPSLSASVSPSNALSPNQNIYPVYVSLQTIHGNPILNAQVTLQVFYPSLFANPAMQDKINGTEIVLLDDGIGNGPDQTRNDGVYSAYLSGFSPKRKAFHLVQLQVTTTANTTILEMAKPTKAILLDERMINKCCGQAIGQLTTKSVPANIKFQTLHLGFKTNDSWTNILQFPPAPITDFVSEEHTDAEITVKFTGVHGDNTGNSSVNVTSYEACCVASNSIQKMDVIPHPEDDDCKPDSVKCDDIHGPGDIQTCSMSKSNLVKLWVPVANKTSVDQLICSLRAVNTNSQYGEISQITLSVNVGEVVQQELADGETSKSKCGNILDDNCVPLWVFWVLIGCLGGVILILVVVVCCWCCCSQRKKRGDTRSTVESGNNPRQQKENVLAVHYSPPSSNPTQTSANDNDPPKVVKELFVNHAYIQDGDGEIKIIADNGQILRKPKNNNNEDAEHGNTLPLPTIQENSQPNMQVFKPMPLPKPNNSQTSQNPKSRTRRHISNERPQIIHPNPMLRSDSTYDDSFERQPPIPLQRQEAPLPPQYIPPKRNNPDPAIVYATISRGGHYTKPQTPTSPPKQVTFDPHYMVPHGSIAVPQNATLLRRQQTSEPTLLYSRSPPHIPNYPPPFSDSETSTDFDVQKRRAARRVPPQFSKPPPYPAGSQLVLKNQQRQNLNNNNFRGGGMPIQSQSLPVGINPPVPPPRYDRSTMPAKIRQNSSIQNFTTKLEMVSTDDDDSDEWDDGDNYEFDNVTGVSYA